MFKNSERLSRGGFDTYFKTGKRIQGPHLTLIYQAAKQRHVSVVVGKKVFKKAHDRNQLRRRVYGVLYRTLTQNNQTGVFIVLTKPSITSLTKKAQIDAVQKLLSRITLTQ